MATDSKSPAVHSAAEFGIRGIGNETEAFQTAVDRLEKEGPAVLRLERGKTYMVTSLIARNGVSLQGERCTLQSFPHASTRTSDDLIHVGAGVDFSIEDLVLRGSGLLLAEGDAVVRLHRVVLAPAPMAQGQASRFVIRERAVLMADGCRTEDEGTARISGQAQDHARFEWKGGGLALEGLSIYDCADARIEVESFDVYTYPGLTIGRNSGALWEALQGDPEHFKQTRDNPRYAADLERWQAHNRTQRGKVYLRVCRGSRTRHAAGAGIRLYGAYTLDVEDSVIGRVGVNDEARLTMRGGELERIEAYGLSTSHLENVDLIARGREDPWHPVTSYLQGYHVMEFSRQYNDLLPRVEFRGGRIEFAGDDCLNGLPEWRALPLMEVVHDHNSVFSDYGNLAHFAPESRAEGEAIPDVRGAAGAVHDEATAPCVPFDFRHVPFRWRGAFRVDGVYVPGHVVSHDGLLYVCNAPSSGVAPNRVFDRWQIFSVAFRNDAGYLQVARRVWRNGQWRWEKRQALGPWHGFSKRERGNPIVTYHVHLVLRDTTVIRHANTWSWAKSPRIPVGDAAYEYVLSCLVANVWFNTENNRVECENVTLEVIGADAMPARGLCLGPNRHTPMESRFEHLRIRGVGVPVCFRIDRAPLRPDNRVRLNGLSIEGEPVKRDDFEEVIAGDARWQYEMLGAAPADWNGIDDYISRFLHPESDRVPRSE